MKYRKVFIAVLVVGCAGMTFQSFGQEGGDPNQPTERPEDVVTKQDSAQVPDGYQLEEIAKDAQRETEAQSQLPSLNSTFFQIPNKEEKNKIVLDEKEKAKEVKNEVSFNIFYYIFYKFKKVD